MEGVGIGVGKVEAVIVITGIYVVEKGVCDLVGGRTVKANAVTEFLDSAVLDGDVGEVAVGVSVYVDAGACGVGITIYQMTLAVEGNVALVDFYACAVTVEDVGN